MNNVMFNCDFSILLLIVSVIVYAFLSFQRFVQIISHLLDMVHCCQKAFAHVSDLNFDWVHFWISDLL